MSQIVSKNKLNSLIKKGNHDMYNFIYETIFRQERGNYLILYEGTSINITDNNPTIKYLYNELILHLFTFQTPIFIVINKLI